MSNKHVRHQGKKETARRVTAGGWPVERMSIMARLATVEERVEALEAARPETSHGLDDGLNARPAKEAE